MIAISDRLDLDGLPDPAIDHITGQELTEEESEVFNFQKWLRETTDLEYGTITDYVKAAYAMLVLGHDPEDVTNGRTAMRKLEEFVESDNNSGDGG